MTIARRIQSSALLRDTEGLSTVEYVILLALIAAFAVASWSAFGENVKQYIDKSGGEIHDNMPGFAKDG